VSNRATETEGGEEYGSDRLKRKQTGHGHDRGCVRQSTSLPPPRPSSSSERGILLDLLPHTLSTDHAHYVFNGSILCKTGSP